jgi:hypothetical protein
VQNPLRSEEAMFRFFLRLAGVVAVLIALILIFRAIF